MPRTWLVVLSAVLLLGCEPETVNFDFDGDGYSDDVDCAPEDRHSHPGADEVCGDGVDNDCDGLVDGEDPDCGSGDDDSAGDDDDDDDTGDDDTSPATDLDGDGWTADDGDCDDADPAVHPGAEDVCDDLDNDCDGQLNEDTAGWDGYESPSAIDLGTLTDTGTFVLSYLQGPGDTDLYEFYVYDEDDPLSDGFSIDIQVFLPAVEADPRLTLTLVEDAHGQPGGTLATVNELPGGWLEELTWEGTHGFDDSGTYAVEVIAHSGYHCEQAYSLSINCGS